MKKIIFCIAFAIIAMITAAASFVVNDIAAYRSWATANQPKIMETFGHKDKKDKDHRKDRHAPPPPQVPAPVPAEPMPAENTQQ